MTTAAGGSTEQSERDRFRFVSDIYSFNAEQRPDKPALRFEDQRLTHRQLYSRGNQIANGLIAAGYQPQTRIGYLGRNDSRYFEALLGCAKAGMVLTPISWRLALPEIVFLLEDFKVECLIVDNEYAGYLDEIGATCGAITRIIAIGEAAGCQEFDKWREPQSARDPAVRRDPDEVVVQIHTSGTTGRPKGTMLTHSNLLNAARHAVSGEFGDWNEDDISLIPVPLFHSGGICWSLYASYVGGMNFITREANSTTILKALRSAPITKMGIVPAILQQIVNDPEFDKRDIGNLQLVAYGGSPITADLLRRGIKELGCGFMQLFGMTETATMGTRLAPEDHDLTRPEILTSCGKPLHDIEIKVVDGAGNELPAGSTGEILLRGGSVMQGYFGKPEATAEALRKGWYHSGDAGYFDEAGYLYIRDRIKDMIICGGENIYPAEVEQALAEHPAVLECGIIGVPSEKWGEEVKAFVVVREGHDVRAEELIAHTRTLIASFKCPKSVDFLQVLPRNPSGKILKRELRAPYWQETGRKIA